MNSRIGYIERTLIHRWIQEKFGIREIARRLGRSPGTVSREIRRNSGGRGYRPKQAQSKAGKRARRPGARRLTDDIKRDIAEKLSLGWSPDAICGHAAMEGLRTSARKPFTSTFTRMPVTEGTYGRAFLGRNESAAAVALAQTPSVAVKSPVALI